MHGGEFAGAVLILSWQKWSVMQVGLKMNLGMCRQVFVHET